MQIPKLQTDTRKLRTTGMLRAEATPQERFREHRTFDAGLRG
jgi:hypothetical protein